MPRKQIKLYDNNLSSYMGYHLFLILSPQARTQGVALSEREWENVRKKRSKKAWLRKTEDFEECRWQESKEPEISFTGEKNKLVE